MPSDKAVVFLQNHDTQHQCGFSYRDGRRLPPRQRLDAGAALRLPVHPLELRVRLPRRKLDGPAVRCRRPHQRRHLRVEPRDRDDRPVGVRAPRPVHPEHGGASGASSPARDVNHWWDNGANAIAFSRGDKGFVAINDEPGTRGGHGDNRPAAGHLLRPPHGRAWSNGLRRNSCGGGRLGNGPGPAQPGVRGRHRRRDALMRILA